MRRLVPFDNAANRLCFGQAPSVLSGGSSDVQHAAAASQGGGGADRDEAVHVGARIVRVDDKCGGAEVGRTKSARLRYKGFRGEGVSQPDLLFSQHNFTCTWRIFR